MFFFSSRRRHTRLQGDWSSDVCSSDLAERLLSCAERAAAEDGSPLAIWYVDLARTGLWFVLENDFARAHRSEERRVGKECKYGGGKYEEKKETSTKAANNRL